MSGVVEFGRNRAARDAARDPSAQCNFQNLRNLMPSADVFNTDSEGQGSNHVRRGRARTIVRGNAAGSRRARRRSELLRLNGEP